MALVPDTPVGEWRAVATALSAARLLAYRPLSSAGALRVPTLVVAAQNDTLCPLRAAERAAALRPAEVALRVLPGAGHFDVYREPHLGRALALEVAFLERHLLGPRA